MGATRLVSRGRLLAALDRAVTRKVTVISAPAGSGKTSVLHAWAERSLQEHRIAFVSVARDQRDEQRFWLSLLEAVRRTLDTNQWGEPPVATPGFNAGALADRVLEALVDNPDRLVLVIDDLHELGSADAQAHLSRLVAELPSHVHAVLGMRRDLQLGLHHLRLAGELAEIRAADLRFTEAETRALLATSGAVLSNEAVATLHSRTEGWAAGLRLAAIALAEHPDAERFVAEFSGSNRAVADYLIAETLERQPAEVQRLLLRTSLLDRVNGELADLLTGSSGSERILLELEDANAFVVSLGAERAWFRYHQLFGELLRLELRRTSPAEVPHLHKLAADWFANHAQPIDAIRHRQAAGDWSNAARLLADHAFSLTLDGGTGTLQALLGAFPRGATGAEDDELALAYATQEIVQNRLDEASAHLELAEQHARTTASERQHRLQVAVASLRLELATRRGHFAGVIDQVKINFLKLSAPLTARSNQDIALAGDLRAFALLVLGIVETWTLRLADAERHLLEGAALAQNVGRPYLEVACLARLGFAETLGFAPNLRSFAVVRERCEAAITVAERLGWGDDRVIAPALATLGGTLLLRGEFAAAAPLLERAAKVSRADTEPGTRLLVHLATGMLHTSRDDLPAALEDFTAAEQIQSFMLGEHALSELVKGWAIATRARLGRLDEARAALLEWSDERVGSGEMRNATAILYLAEGDPTAALNTLAEVLDGLAPVMHDSTLVEAHLLDARAHAELAEHRSANAALENALAAAEADRLIFPFVMTGSRDLLEGLPRHETAHAALLMDVLDVQRGSSVTRADQPRLPRLQALTETEQRVLRFLPTNLSRPEIAHELYLSVNTVNTHVRNIFAKLDTRTRSAAVDRARELRLLSTSVSH